jgi:hypothetical protein
MVKAILLNSETANRRESEIKEERTRDGTFHNK